MPCRRPSSSASRRAGWSSWAGSWRFPTAAPLDACAGRCSVAGEHLRSAHVLIGEPASTSPGHARQHKEAFVATHRLGIIMHGVTGRMGLNQHLDRSIVAIRKAGGVTLPNGDRVMPDPILVGRNAEKVAALAKQYGIERSTTDLDAALKNPNDTVFFDAATTQMRADLVTRAIEAGKHIYCEKPVADSLAKAVALAKLAKARGIRHGVVQDKLFLPGLRKMRMLRDSGFFGRLFAVRGEFGYWVFEGDWGQPAPRPSWNYKKAEGGGIILDMLCHWRYVLDNLFGEVRAVSCLGATHIPERVDE